MMMNRKIDTSFRNCAFCFCETSNHPSICDVCVNYRLNEFYYTKLKALKSKRDALYTKLTNVLLAKGKADDQKRWIMLQKERVVKAREKLLLRKEQLIKGKAKNVELSQDLKEKYELLESSMTRLQSIRLEQLKFFSNLICTQSLAHVAINSDRLRRQSVIIKQICKLFPQRRLNLGGENKEGYNGPHDAICNARLPRGLDPHSVPSEELAASLGCLVQLLNLVIHNVCANALHNTGFACIPEFPKRRRVACWKTAHTDTKSGSCSRIWERDSYWDARPSSRSIEYPLYIPHQIFCSTGGENSWTENCSSNFGVVASMESIKNNNSDSLRRNSFTYSSASPHSREIH